MVRTVGLAVVAAALIATPGANASARWTRQANLPTGQDDPSVPALAFDGRGAALAAWKTTPIEATGPRTFATASRLPDRTWITGPRVRAARGFSLNSTPAGRLQLRRSQRRNGCELEVFPVRIGLGGPALGRSFLTQCSRPFSTKAWSRSTYPLGARAAARVERRRGRRFVVVRRAPPGRPLGRERTVAEVSNRENPSFVEDVVVNRRGDIAVLWDDGPDLRSRILDAAGVFGPVRTVPYPSGEIEEMNVLLGARRELLVLYSGYGGDPDASSDYSFVDVAVQRRSQRRFAPLKSLCLSRTSVPCSGAGALTADGRAVVVWTSTSGSTLTTAVLGGRGLTGLRRHAAGPGTQPEIALAPDGSVLATWELGNGLRAALRRPGAIRFGPTERVLSARASIESTSVYSVAFDPRARRFTVVAAVRPKPRGRAELRVLARRP